jgi:hypothetical protein
MTRQEATDLARQFVREQVRTNQEWDTITLASYLDVHQVLRDGALFSASPTISNIAGFYRAETIEHAR